MLSTKSIYLAKLHSVGRVVGRPVKSTGHGAYVTASRKPSGGSTAKVWALCYQLLLQVYTETIEQGNKNTPGQSPAKGRVTYTCTHTRLGTRYIEVGDLVHSSVASELDVKGRGSRLVPSDSTRHGRCDLQDSLGE